MLSLISTLALEPNVTVHEMTATMQAWQLRMGRMMQEQHTYERGSYQWDMIQANLDAIARATDLVDANTPVKVRLLI
jgi:hypothetical protein